MGGLGWDGIGIGMGWDGMDLRVVVGIEHLTVLIKCIMIDPLDKIFFLSIFSSCITPSGSCERKTNSVVPSL